MSIIEDVDNRRLTDMATKVDPATGVRGSDGAHKNALTIPFGDLVDFFRNIFGNKLTAYMAGIKDDKRVNKWVAGEPASAKTEQHLRDAYQVAFSLLTVEGEDVVRAWFIGMNPQLDDQPPARLIRDGRAPEVMAAARSFMESA